MTSPQKQISSSNNLSLLPPGRLASRFIATLTILIALGQSAAFAEETTCVEDVVDARLKIDLKARPFRLSQVRLTDGYSKQTQEANRRYLHALDADRLLHSFRVTAGLPSTANPLGGWESPKGLAVDGSPAVTRKLCSNRSASSACR